MEFRSPLAILLHRNLDIRQKKGSQFIKNIRLKKEKI